MNMSSTLDPFHLAKLTETIDRDVFRILSRDFPAIVSEENLKSIKTKIRDEVNTLISEMWNEVQHLNQHPQFGNFFDAEDRIPTVVQMAEQLPNIFVGRNQAENNRADVNDQTEYWKRRLKWVFNIWLQVYGSMIQRVADGNTVVGETTINFDGIEELVRMPLPSEIDAVNSAWQLVRRLTLEYLQAKAELFIAAGEDVPHIAINFDDESDRDSIELRKAFWHNSPEASLLMLYTLRGSLLRVMQLKTQILPIDLRMIPTSQLLLLAQGAGVNLPFSLQLLGNITYDLEGSFSNCQQMSVSVLYPFYRLIEETISHLNSMSPNEKVQQRALEILAQNAQRYSNEPANQTDNQRS